MQFTLLKTVDMIVLNYICSTHCNFMCRNENEDRSQPAESNTGRDTISTSSSVPLVSEMKEAGPASRKGEQRLQLDDLLCLL